MSFELDPVFHTETMVKILHEQGQIYYATQLCEEIVSKSTDNSSALSLLEAIKKGRIPEKVPNYQAKVAEEEAIPGFPDDIVETTEPGITFEALEIKDENEPLKEAVLEAAAPILENPEKIESDRKLDLLNALLFKVQERKYEVH